MLGIGNGENLGAAAAAAAEILKSHAGSQDWVGAFPVDVAAAVEDDEVVVRMDH